METTNPYAAFWPGKWNVVIGQLQWNSDMQCTRETPKSGKTWKLGFGVYSELHLHQQEIAKTNFPEMQIGHINQLSKHHILQIHHSFALNPTNYHESSKRQHASSNLKLRFLLDYSIIFNGSKFIVTSKAYPTHGIAWFSKWWWSKSYLILKKCWSSDVWMPNA